MEKATRNNTTPVLVRLHTHTLPQVDRAAAVLDLDRTKFIRQAVREKLARVRWPQAAGDPALN